jgi:hypothetical protein
VAWCVRGWGWLASVGWAGCNVLRCEFHQKNLTVKPWPLMARVVGDCWTLALLCNCVATQDRVFPYYASNSSTKHSKSDSKDRSQEIL